MMRVVWREVKSFLFQDEKLFWFRSSIRDFERCFIGKWTPHPTPTQHKLCTSSMLCCCGGDGGRRRWWWKSSGREEMKMFCLCSCWRAWHYWKKQRLLNFWSQAASAAISHTPQRLVNFFLPSIRTVFSFFTIVRSEKAAFVYSVNEITRCVVFHFLEFDDAAFCCKVEMEKF